MSPEILSIVMAKQSLRLRAFAFTAGLVLLAFGGWASADPPSRVARLGYMTGAVSFSPAGEHDWVHATLNRPLTTGDRLWADAAARAEVQIGGAMIRMSAGTAVSVLNLDDRIAQLQLTQGILNVRVRRLETDQVFEVDTPNLAFTLRGPGQFRIEVDPDGDATTIIVRKGRGEAYGEGAAYVIDSRQPYRFTGTDLREYEYVRAPRLDEFDRWSSDRDRRYDTSVSARYLSQDVIGYQDLDANGTWRVDATYGNVWFPSRVGTGWAPYRDGHWAWVDPWGWTWVDDAPWGFAVSHYGRWANLRGTWGWVPGPARTRAYYAPALVVFLGGDNFQLAISGGNVGGVAWFPLGPREVYRPAYSVSRSYFENINTSNTVVSSTTINNYYNNTNVTNVVYSNQQVPGAIVAVPTTAFVQSQPVSRAAVPISREVAASARVAVAATVAPTERSVRGATTQGGPPPARAFERPSVARTAPPAAPVGFAAQQRQLATKPGKPLEEAARRQLKPATATPAPAVRVVAPAQVAPPTAPPPPVAAAARARPADRKEPAAPSAQAVPPPEARGKPEQQGKAAPKEPPPQRLAKPASAAPAPQLAPPATSAPQRVKPEATSAARQAQPRSPVATPEPSQAQPTPKGEARGKEPKPDAGKSREKSKEGDEQKREEEDRKQKR